MNSVALVGTLASTPRPQEETQTPSCTACNYRAGEPEARWQQEAW